MVLIPFPGFQYFHSWYGTETVEGSCTTAMCVLFLMISLGFRLGEVAHVLAHMDRWVGDEEERR